MDQRRYPRIGPLVIRTDFQLGDDRHEGYILSLSEGGAFLAIKDPIAVGGKISLKLDLPWGLGEIETEAVVVYHGSQSDSPPQGYPRGVGLVFVHPSPLCLERIRSYVSRFHQLVSELEEPDRRG